MLDELSELQRQLADHRSRLNTITEIVSLLVSKMNTDLDSLQEQLDNFQKDNNNGR